MFSHSTVSPFFCRCLLSHTQTAEYNKGSNPGIDKQRIESSPLTPDFHSWEERKACQRGSAVSALTAGWYKLRLLQYGSFGRMCCVCEINGNASKLSTALHLLCHLVKLSGCSGSTVPPRWMETRGVGQLSGNVPSSPRPLRLIAPSSVLYLHCSHHAQGSTKKYKEKPSAERLPQLNQDASHGCLLSTCTR